VSGTSDAAFAAGPPRGSFAANARFADGRFLLDQAGDGFTGILFSDGPGTDAERALLAGLARLDRRFKAIVVAMPGAQVRDVTFDDADGRVGAVYGASAGTFYLLRPDLHVAGRWLRPEAAEITRALAACLGKVVG
jgi:3-(3-hydroxy-phenyl)propionate hydroxylase